METLTYGTPGLLFPAISLLMLAYTNRFLGLTAAARSIIARYEDHRDPSTSRLLLQIASLRERLALVRLTQVVGVLSLLCCTSTLFALFLQLDDLARVLFAAALLLMMASLVISLREIYLSVRAINIEFDHLNTQ